ncbi:MAG: acylphosphatase [Bacteroidales bacterium]|nr:acylphosphatase [Bacteroidales bacterium]
MLTYKIHISGKVFKNGYRYFLKEQASRHQISGYVNYLPDRSVEIVASGFYGSLQKFFKACSEGFTGNEVDSVRLEEIPVREFESFEVIDKEIIQKNK